MGGEDAVECGLVEVGIPALAKDVDLWDVQRAGDGVRRTAREAISHWDLVMFRAASGGRVCTGLCRSPRSRLRAVWSVCHHRRSTRKIPSTRGTLALRTFSGPSDVFSLLAGVRTERNNTRHDTLER